MGLLPLVATDATLHFFAARIFMDLDMKWDRVSLDDVISTGSVYMTDVQLLAIRFILMFFVLGIVYHMVSDKNGFKVRLANPAGELITFRQYGWQRITAFTTWCWTLQGVYFALVSGLTILKNWFPQVLDNSSFCKDNMWLIVRIVWSMYEVSFAMAFMVTVVVTFVLIPVAEKKGLPHDNFYVFFTICMHNFNTAFMVFELFFNRMPIALEHTILCFYWGYAYVFFSRYWYKMHGYFYYFFLDITKPLAPVFLVGLNGIYSLFMVMGHYIDKLVTAKPGGETYKETVMLIIFTLFVMKWPPADKWHIMTDDFYNIINGRDRQDPTSKGNKERKDESEQPHVNPLNTTYDDAMVSLRRSSRIKKNVNS